ncbi:MAG TPA: molybdopterin-guanine dinucleotide biosynthesis protein B [Halanaerobiales bacterium]|nr:molybdopterin-guanine dinucleotide biosynthesis protein B [Halanaerobiales bacterium]
MKIFSVFGISGTGKTTTIEKLLAEIKKRNYTVGSIKEIHFEDFAIDTEGTNTYRHRQAGSELVTARGYYETDILFPRRLELEELIKYYHHDYLVIEGVEKGNFPKVLTAKNIEEIEERFDETVIAISGRISEEIDNYKGIPAINALDDVSALFDLIESKSFEVLPDFPPECCTACGYSCRELAVKIIKGEASREDCIISRSNIKLLIDGEEIEMVPFVQRLLRNAVMGVVSELEGYQPGSQIELRIGNHVTGG